MARRKITNRTGIRRIEGINYHDAWIGYICLKCKHLNSINIGQNLLAEEYAYNNCEWKCIHCEYVHSKKSNLPFLNWDKKLRKATTKKVQRFWLAFFRIATESKESYWKQCNSCGRILPYAAFSRHSKWGPLERQMECRSCKGAINAILNPKRTHQQLHESTTKRRLGDLLMIDENEGVDIEDLFKRFEGKCFKTGIKLDINNRESYNIDHILPASYLYPLTKENACLLSTNINAKKRNLWPSYFFTNIELIRLAEITGADLSTISSKVPIVNPKIDVNKCVQRILNVREKSSLHKRIKELKKIIKDNELVSKLSPRNKRLLGI